jgi:hypothetical protein
MLSLRGQASWAKMMLTRGKLIASACHLIKKVNKAEGSSVSGFSWAGSHFLLFNNLII